MRCLLHFHVAVAESVRGSYSGRVPRSSLAEVYRNLSTTSWKMKLMAKVKKHDRREDRQQEEERREVAENQTHNMSA